MHLQPAVPVSMIRLNPGRFFWRLMRSSWAQFQRDYAAAGLQCCVDAPQQLFTGWFCRSDAGYWLARTKS